MEHAHVEYTHRKTGEHFDLKTPLPRLWHKYAEKETDGNEWEYIVVVTERWHEVEIDRTTVTSVRVAR